VLENRARRRCLELDGHALCRVKKDFAGTQAAEMGEELPLTYFCRSRGTCDMTSAARRSVRGGTRWRAV
jgi:hypothetical protein